MKIARFLSALTLCSVIFLQACSTAQIQQTAAIVQSGGSIAAQLDPQLVPYLQGAQALYSAYQGFTIPPSSINTGNARVDAVLQKATTSAPVVEKDISTIQTAIANLQSIQQPQ